jgi:hypothetical protein
VAQQTPAQGMAALMAELTNELAAIVDYSTAVAMINGQLGGYAGIRTRYVGLANAFVSAGHAGPQLSQNVSTLCDRRIAELAPVQCEATGWSSIPRSALTEKLK